MIEAKYGPIHIDGAPDDEPCSSNGRSARWLADDLLAKRKLTSRGRARPAECPLPHAGGNPGTAAQEGGIASHHRGACRTPDPGRLSGHAMTDILAKVEIIRTDGTHERHLLLKDGLLRRIEELIGADCTDAVNLCDGRVLIVNDRGYETEVIQHDAGHIELKPVRALLPLNPEATRIYRSVTRPNEHNIVGDVAITEDKNFE
jgi:hypothetical protein